MPRSSDVIVEVCRAGSPEELQVLIGATTAWWSALGYAVQACRVVPGAVGVYAVSSRTSAAGAPQQLGADAGDAFTAVLVMTG